MEKVEGWSDQLSEKWLADPESVSVKDGALEVCPKAKSDFWSKVFYGFVFHNGHFLYYEIPSEHENDDLIISTEVQSFPKHQYDQAGLMVRYSNDCWLKTSMEYEPADEHHSTPFNRLGSVVTNNGFSDWATQDYPLSETNRMQLRIRKLGPDFIVEWRDPEKSNAYWAQMRMARLVKENPDAKLQIGLYCASPIDAGYKAVFKYLKIENTKI